MATFKYTAEQLRDGVIADLLNDARCAREQAEEGPFYPDRKITSESLLIYADKCEEQAAAHAKGEDGK